MKLYNIIAFSVLLTSGVQAAANPTYLTCRYDVNGQEQVHEFTLDEANSQASMYIATTGYSRTGSATFTPERVIFEERPFTFTISRTDLSISRTIRGLGTAPTTGTCQLRPNPPRRAF